MARGYKYFEAIEKNAALLGVLTLVMVSLGGLSEITPIFVEAHSVTAPQGVKPYDALRLAGRDIYVRDGCYLCHSQMIRSLRAETQRYGAYSVASESVYDRPFQWGSKRTGPDLARVGGKYSDEWQRQHLIDPRRFVPESNMPAYPWLLDAKIDGATITERMRALRALGDPYTDADIAGAAKAVEGKTEMDAIVAYLQGLGVLNVAKAAEAPATSGAPASDNQSGAGGKR